MAADTIKRASPRDADQTQRISYNDVNGSHTVDGFLTGIIGRKVTMSISQTTVPDDTETFVFSELGVNLYTIQIVYTSDTRETMISAERIA